MTWTCISGDLAAYYANSDGQNFDFVQITAAIL